MRSTEHLSQTMRAHSLDLALRTPHIRNSAEVLKAAQAYMEHIAGNSSADQPAQLPPGPGAAHPGYSAMQPHQRRVVDEKAELDEKHRRLRAFLIGGVFAELEEAEQNRLQSQVVAMKVYSDILGERIAAFVPT